MAADPVDSRSGGKDLRESVTVVVVPRERFSYTRQSVESIRHNTLLPFRWVYVDGGSPRPVARYLRSASGRMGFELVRRERYLTPNQARNLGFERVDTEYVVFVDNDVLVEPGWLEALVRCAQETGAVAVGPLYCIGLPAGTTVHMAGGEASLHRKNGVLRLHELHRHQNLPVAQVEAHLVRSRCELIEFHCMLVRSSALRRLGPFDERLMNTREHIDFCLTLRAHGHDIWFEPASRLTYVAPPPFAWGDVPYYLLRWSDQWSRSTMRHFNAKWNLEDDSAQLIRNWIRPHRRAVFGRAPGIARRWLGRRLGSWVTRRVIDCVESCVIARARGKGAAPIERRPHA